MSTPQTSSPSKASEPPNPRKRGRTACTRCKTRKQKCDDQLPVCSNCRKSGALCDKVNIAEETIPASYTRALEDQVAFLETKLQQHQDDEAPTNVGERTGGAQNNSSRYALSDIVAHISLGNPEEPAYVGSSSGMSLAMILNEMVQATLWNKSLPDAIGTEEGSLADNLSNSGAKRMEIGDLLAQSVKEPPSDELGTRMIKAYLMQLHPRYPFLDPSDIWKLHENRYALSAIPPRELCREQRFGVFKLDLIYAIGATLVQLTDKRTSISPEGFYMAALQHISAARESRTIQNIEAMTLLVVYHLRSASSHGMWYMIGLAMRTCIDLGMHRKGNERAVSPETLDRRRRLFLTVYSLERTIAISLGRPVSISDRLIDVELPASLEDDPSPRGYVQSPTHGSTPTPRVALHLFRLRRIESHIQHSIYRADKPLSSLIHKLDPLYNTLVSWRSSLQADFPLGSPELDYPLLHYHRATRLLIQPFLPLLTLSDAYHGLCLRAAGDICQAHKRLHQTLDYGHSFIAVQTVFVAGVTLAYGLWRWMHDAWSVALADDIRACSLVLFVMGERAEWVRRYRDAFELLVNAAMGKLNGEEPNLARPRTSFRQSSTKRRRVDSAGRSGSLSYTPVSQESRSMDHEDVFHIDHQASSSTAGDSSWRAGGGIAVGEGTEAWPIVMELAPWMDQDEGSPVWMPDFEMLHSLER